VQVGLVWQGGNGVDDLLREQMDMDIFLKVQPFYINTINQSI
jgi:hypothetical protein